ILATHVGPELADQLQAIGAFLTAEKAGKLKKSVEQTGTSFGNLLVDNLGGDQIPAAIDEIIAKSGISFDELADKLTMLFEGNKIGADFYTSAIAGAVDIFHDDLPAAIGVSALALASFTDDGVFSLSTFQEKLAETTGVFSTIGEAAVEALRNSSSGEEAARIFGEQLQQGLEDLAVDRFIATFLDEQLFAGIDLSDGLGADEIATLTERVAGARGELEALRTALAETDTIAGQTGDTLSAVAQSAVAIFDQISFNAVSTLRSVVGQVFSASSEFSVVRFAPGAAAALGRTLGKDLGAALREEIATSVTDAIQDAIIQVAIQDAILTPFKEALSALAKEAFADGILTPDEIARIVDLGQVAADAATGTAQAIAPILEQIERGGEAIAHNFELGADAFQGINLNPLLAQAEQFRNIIESTQPPTLPPPSAPISPAPAGFAAGGFVPGPG
ncbi:MAG: hypothetical protein ACRDRT_08670, partial [Pseudonocardiaceae bacterium]